jgi:hypothetical protein
MSSRFDGSATNGGAAGTSGTITVRTGTIEAMTTTSGEGVTDTDIAMAITVHVGAVMAVGVAVGRITTRKGMTTSNEPPA